MRKRLKNNFSGENMAVYSSFDIIGDIAITKLPSGTEVKPQDVAAAIMRRHKKVKVVYLQEGAVGGEHRVRSLIHVAGENRARTLHRENGCVFSVDVETCYFSPRLSHERMRTAQLVQPAETVVNMFSGVGCFSVLIAKHQPTAKVYSIDINSEAVQFMEENVRLNRVYGNVVLLLGDAKEIIARQLQGCADRVLMPLPEKAYLYLPSALSALKPAGGWIHLHAFEHAAKPEGPAEKVRQKVREALEAHDRDYEVPNVRVVRSTGPNWWQLVADVHVN